MQKMTPAYALPWDFQAKTFDYRETIWGVYQDDDKIFRKSKNAVQQPSHSLEKVTVNKLPITYYVYIGCAWPLG